MRDIYPLWYQGDGPTAHLLQPGRGQDAWCGAVIDISRLAPYRTRCKSCLKVAAKYAEEAAVEPPARVRTTLTLIVEHDADVTTQDVLTTAGRRVLGPAASPNWVLYSSKAEPPVPVTP